MTWCEEDRCRKGIGNDADFDIAEALTKENLALSMSMLEFGKVRGYLHRTTIMDDRLGSIFKLLWLILNASYPISPDSSMVNSISKSVVLD